MIKKYFWQILVLILLVIIFLMNSCEQEINTKDNYIIIKEKTGYFEIKKPTPVKGVGYTFVTSKGDTIYLENPVDKELEAEYLKAKDSLAKLELYLKAIQKRTYKDSLEDENIVINYEAKTTGTLDNIKIDYKTKLDSVKIKKPVFVLYTGLGTSVGQDLSPGVKINLGYQNKKGSVIFAGYDPINKVATVDYNIKIFDIKK